MGLTLLQQNFRDWLRHADADAGTRLDLADARGLAVYQNNYRASLMACLEDGFPQLLAWLGDAAFYAAAAHHIDEHPPSSWTLDDYPAGFPADLRSQFPGDPEIADLAELEWRLAECFVAADAAVLELEVLGEIDWECAQLRLAPSVCLLTMRTNAAQIWSALSAEAIPPAATSTPEPVTLVIWRQDFVTCFRPIDPDEHQLLMKLQQGLGFTEMCATLVEELGEGDGVARAGALLAGWTSDQVLCLRAGAIGEPGREIGR
ncbi:MAG: DNA-binding domain-containing protein [Novosphingobium sp.]